MELSSPCYSHEFAHEFALDLILRSHEKMRNFNSPLWSPFLHLEEIRGNENGMRSVEVLGWVI